MLRTNEENKRWWNSLSKQVQSELFDKILNKASNPRVQEWAMNLIESWERGSPLTDKNLESLRKWE